MPSRTDFVFSVKLFLSAGTVIFLFWLMNKL